MNLKIHNVLSQTTGVSGLALIRAVVSGEREPSKLVELCAAQILKTNREKMLLALQGTYRAEHLFALRQALECWEHYQKQIAQCDRQIEALLAKMTAGKEAPPLPAGCQLKKLKQHPPQIHNLHDTLMKLTGGKDPTLLPAMTDYGLLMLLSAIGTEPHEYIVNLTGVSNAQEVTVALTGVRDTGGDRTDAGRQWVYSSVIPPPIVW